MAEIKKSFPFRQNALELRPLSIFLAKIIFVKFSFLCNTVTPDKSYIFEKPTLLGIKISWEYRFIGQQPFFCIRNHIAMEFSKLKSTKNDFFQKFKVTSSCDANNSFT